MPNNYPNSSGAHDPSHGDAASWSAQLNESFLFSPYWGPGDKEPFTATSITSAAESSERLLSSLHLSPLTRQEEFVSFVQQHAESVVATVLSLSFDEGRIAKSVNSAALKTLRRIAEFGEVGAREVERATMVPPVDVTEPVLGPTAAGFVALSMGDASAALAAQRGGLSASFGRAVFAAELILELRDVLHSRLT